MIRKLAAELLGTFWLVLGGCGTAVLTGGYVGGLGIALAFGLSALTGAYALGRISGGHFNPAVSLGLALGGRFPAKAVLPYALAQVAGAAAAAQLLFSIAQGAPDFDMSAEVVGAFATNGYGDLSPGGYALGAAFLTETVLTAVFLLVIMGVTGKGAPAAFAPVAIGLALTLIHLISIPVTNTSVNPARSTGVALIVGTPAMAQLWLFWAAPLLGAGIGGLLHRWLYPSSRGARQRKLFPQAGLKRAVPLPSRDYRGMP